MAAARKDTGKQEVPDDGVAQAIQEATDEAEEQGFLGVKVDPTPNSHYTLQGVTSGKPVPETDPKAAAEARRASEGR